MVVSEKKRNNTGRSGANEGLGGSDADEGRLQIVDVSRRRLRIAHADLRVARRRLTTRAARITEDFLRKFRKLDQVSVDETVTRAAEPVQPILDVGRVAGFGHLTIVDDVDTGGHLLLDDLCDGEADSRGKQIDCPDLAMGRHIQYRDLDTKEFRKRATQHVEALNHALANIPPEQLRIPPLANSGSKASDRFRAMSAKPNMTIRSSATGMATQGRRANQGSGRRNPIDRRLGQGAQPSRVRLQTARAGSRTSRHQGVRPVRRIVAKLPDLAHKHTECGHDAAND